MECYMFGDSVTSVRLLMETTASLRRAGYRTHVTTELLHGFTVHTLHAVPPARPTRRERGCEL